MMQNNYFMVRVLLASFMMLAPLQPVMADDDYVEARHLLSSGEILPLEDILKNVRQVFPGNVLEVELEKKDKRVIYEMEILGEDGVIREVYVDARTGELLFAKEDD